MDSQPRKVRVAMRSVVSNTTLVALKLIVGLLIGSVSILSEAIHSGVDLLAAIIALFSVTTSSRPADRQHPFGHGKIENVSGTVEALLILAAAGWIIYEAARKMLHPEPIADLGWGVIVMAASACVNIIVSEMLFKIGKETDSVALKADAWHLRTDVYTSAGVMASLAVIWTIHKGFPGVNVDWLDPAAAIGVALLIIKAAYDLTREAIRDLLDEELPSQEVDLVRKCILMHRHNFRGFHHLRTRKSGHFRFVEFHLKVDPQMSVSDSHTVTEEISDGIKNRYPGTSVTIHIEPCNGNCVGNCLDGCLLPRERWSQIQDEIYSA